MQKGDAIRALREHEPFNGARRAVYFCSAHRSPSVGHVTLT